MADFPGLQILIVCILGLCLGSFATALIWRVPRGRDWLSSRSACTMCGKPLGIIALIPVLSWMASRGKCRYCGRAVSMLYPVIEIGVMSACLAVYFVDGIYPASVIVMLAVPFLAALLVIDMQQMILPDQIMLPLVILGVMNAGYATYAGGGDIEIALIHLLGAALFIFVAWIMGTVTTKILGRESLGMGDVKFFAMAGLWLGPGMLPLFLIASGMSGIIFGIVWRKITKNDVFPFGPALIFAFLVGLMVKFCDISIPYLTF